MANGQDDPVSSYLDRYKSSGGPDPVQSYISTYQEPEDPVGSYLSQYGGSEPDSPGIMGRLRGIARATPEFLKQGAYGVRDAYGRAAEIVTRAGESRAGQAVLSAVAPGSELAFQPEITGSAEELGQYYDERAAESAPTSTAGMVGRVAGNIVGEGSQYIAGGGVMRSALGSAIPALARTVPAAGTSLRGRAAIGVGEALKDALAVAPIDAAVVSLGPENSMAGAAAMLAEERHPELAARLQGWADNPLKRFGFEAATGLVGDVAIRGALGATRGAARAASDPLGMRQTVRGGLKEGSAQAIGAGPPPAAVDRAAVRYDDVGVRPEARVEEEPSRGLRRRLADAIDPSREVELEQAFRDPMTGLPNQTAFRRAQPRLDADPDVEIAALDVQNLKAINDIEGSEAADAFLAEVGRVAREVADERGMDPRNVFRAGGDEFSVAARPGEAGKVADEIARRIGTRRVGESEFETGLRVGVGDTWREADAAAQVAKKTEAGARFRTRAEGSEPPPPDLMAPPAARMEAEGATTTGRLRGPHADLSDDELTALWQRYQRGGARTTQRAEEATIESAVRYVDDSGNAHAGLGGGNIGEDWRTNARGLQTQVERRIEGVEREMERRGLTPPETIYEGIGRTDVQGEFSAGGRLWNNKELVGRAGEGLRSLDEDQLAREIRETVGAWEQSRASGGLNERLALLYEEAQKRAPGLLDEFGGVPPEVLAGITRAGVGAVAGGAIGAQEGEAVRTAIAGAGLLGGGPRVARMFRNMDERGALDLFGEGVERVRQGDMLEGRGPQGMTEAVNEARATVSSLEGKIQRGDASVEEARRYNDARSLLRRSEGRGLDADEVRARQKEPGEPDVETGDLFEDEFKSEPREDVAYRGMHSAPEEGAPLHDLTELYPDDIYGPDAAQYYGHVGKGDPLDEETIRRIQMMRGQPRKRITIFRAVPKDAPDEILPGDWVTINRKYADQHGESNLGGDYKIVRKYVRAEELITDANSIHEFGYVPRGEDKSVAGFTTPTIARTIAGGGAGAATGAAVDDENRLRGALVGGAVGLGAERAGSRLFGRRAESLTPAEIRHLENPSVRQVVETVSDGSPPRVPDVETFADKVKGFGRWLRYKGIRTEVPMEHFEQAVTGPKTASTELRNELARARGWLPQAFSHLEERLKPVLQAVEEAPTLVNALLKAERGLELARFGKETSAEQLRTWRETVAELGGIAEVRAGAEQVREYYRNLLDMKLDAGVITREQYDAIVERGEFYIPFLPEDVAEFVPAGVGGGRYAPNRGTGVRRMSDALNEATTVDPVDQAVIDTYETFQRTAKQRVANVIGDLVERHPEEASAFIERLPKRPERTEGRNIVEAIVDGERRYYEVSDRDLYESWSNFNKPMQSTLLKASNAMRRFMQAGVTGHPAFALVNGIRDFMVSGVQYSSRAIPSASRAAATGGAGAVVGGTLNQDDPLAGALTGAAVGLGGAGALHATEHLGRTLSALNDILGPELTAGLVGGVGGALSADEDESEFLRFLAGMGIGAAGGRGARLLGMGGDQAIYREFRREGGSGFGFYAKNMRQAKRMRQELMKEGVTPQDFINPRSWWDAIQYVSRAVETAPRLARYKHVRGRGGSVGDAVFEARDLSLDFSVKPGSRALQGLTKTVPFMNPAIQGMDKLARLMKDPQTSAVAAGTILAPTIGLWMLNKDNPEYQNRPIYEKNTYWLIPKGGDEGGFFRVPKPFEIGFIYSSVPERALDYLYTKDPERLQFALQDMWGQYGPASVVSPPMPIGPLYEATRGEHGYDPFRRRTVNPYPWKEIPPEMQYDERTSTLGVQAGRLLGVSPAKVDYVVEGMTGTLGSAALEQSSRAARRLGLDDRPSPMARTRPVFSRMHTSPTQLTEPELAFRRKWQKSERAYNGLREIVQRGDIEDAREFAREHGEELARYEEMKTMAGVISDVWDVRSAIYDSEDMSDEEKRRRLAGINRRLASVLSDMQQGGGFSIPGGRSEARAAPPN